MSPHRVSLVSFVWCAGHRCSGRTPRGCIQSGFRLRWARSTRRLSRRSRRTAALNRRWHGLNRDQRWVRLHLHQQCRCLRRQASSHRGLGLHVCAGEHRSKCGSWLACDGGLSVNTALTDPPLSQASQLPQGSTVSGGAWLHQRNRVIHKHPILILVPRHFAA